MKKFVSLTVFFLITTSWVNGQKTFHSLEEIWSYGLKNNPDNTVYNLQVDKAVKDYKAARSYIYPKIGVGLSGQYNSQIPETPVPGELTGNPGEPAFVQLGLAFNYNAGFNLSKTLLDWQSMFQARIAQSNVSLVKAEKAVFEQNFKQQLAQVYYATLTAKEAVDLSQKDLTVTDSILLLSTNKFQQGLIDNLTLNQTKINRNNALDRWEQNKQYLFENETNLKILLGLAPDDTLLLSENIQLNADVTLETIAPDDLNANLYKIQTENAGFITKQAKSRFLPKLELYGFLGGVQYQEDFNVSTDDWQGSRYLGLNLSVPLFTGFATKNQYRSAQISQNIAKLNYDEAMRKSSLNDSIILNNYFVAENSVQTAKQNLELADQNVQLAYSKYSEGLISLDNYLSVYDDYLSVENQYFSKMSDYFIKKAIILSRNR